MSQKKNTYQDAGVNIDAGNALVDRIKSLTRSTSRPGADGEIGGFGGLFDLAAAGFNNPILVSSTDGVGTKLKIAQETGKHDTIGIDLVAMCVNDILVQGAEPLFFLDYFATGKLDVGVAEQVVKGITEGCLQSKCALIGGETAEMPGMYADGEYDLAGFAVGAVDKQRLLPTPGIFEGDVLLAIPSSGVHSNGYSLVRHIIKEQGLKLSSPAPFAPGKTLGEALLEPTIIYAKHVRSLLKGRHVKGMVHVTGGGLTENTPRVLPKNCAAEIDLKSWEFPPVFKWLQEAGGIEQSEMLRTFNCGIGMILIVSQNNLQAAKEILKLDGVQHITIGKLVGRTGESQQVVYTNA